MFLFLVEVSVELVLPVVLFTPFNKNIVFVPGLGAIGTDYGDHYSGIAVETVQPLTEFMGSCSTPPAAE